MHKSGLPQMRSKQSQGQRSWFRVDNAFVDEENADKEVTPVYIYDVIGDSWFDEGTSASNFIKQIGNIKTPKIELHLNSPGGDIFDGVAIYNALKSHPAQVTVVVDALAASAASFIAQAGDEVIMTKAATMMIHDGSGMTWGTAADMRSTAELLDKLSNTVAEIYSDRAGQTVEFWRELMIEEVWYNSHEAVAAGLADKIGEDTSKEDDEAAQNKWDLSIFNHAGRNDAPNPFQVRQRIANRLKEITVTAGPKKKTHWTMTKNQEGTNPPKEEETSGSPNVNPDAQTTDGQAQEVQEEREEQSATGVPSDAPAEGAPPATAPENKATTQVANQANGQVTFTVDGQTVTYSATEAAAELSKLTQFYNTARTENRKNFVTQLAADNKILAPQIDKMTAYALSLTDEGFDAWKDTWDGVPGHTMLQGSHAEGTSNHDGSQTEARDDAADRQSILKDTVKHMKNGGLSEDAIKRTPSYKALLELDPNFKL